MFFEVAFPEIALVSWHDSPNFREYWRDDLPKQKSHRNLGCALIGAQSIMRAAAKRQKFSLSDDWKKGIAVIRINNLG